MSVADNGNKWERVLTVVFLYLTAYTIMKDAITNIYSLENWIIIPTSAAVLTVAVLLIINHSYIKK